MFFLISKNILFLLNLIIYTSTFQYKQFNQS